MSEIAPTPIPPEEAGYRPENGYIAAVLDETSKSIIESWAIHPTLKSEHLTMAFRPESSEVWNHYVSMVGQEIDIPIVGMAVDHSGQALIANAESANECPHITLSCADGVKPVYSNRLVKDAIENDTVKYMNGKLILKGRVTFIPFK